MKKSRMDYNKNATGICLSILFFLVLTTGGCTGEEERKGLDIPLPSTPAITLETNWGLITSSHLRLRREPTLESDAISTLWRGYVLEILSQTPFMEEAEDMTDYWYRISYDGLQGWVFGGYLDIFNSRDDADRASMEIRS